MNQKHHELQRLENVFSKDAEILEMFVLHKITLDRVSFLTFQIAR